MVTIRGTLLRRALLVNAVFIVVLYSVKAPGLTPAMKFTLAVVFATISGWSLQIMPLAVVALIPLAAMGLSGFVPPSRVMGYYLQPITLMLVGVYLMGSATLRSGLALRIAYYLMSRKWVGGDPRRMGLSLMLASAIISVFISNTACVALFLPIVQAITAAIGTVQSEYVEDAGNAEVKPRYGLTFSAYLVFCVLLGAQSSGFALMIGSPVSIAVNGVLEKLTANGMGIARWAQFGVPMSVAVFIAFYATLTWISRARQYTSVNLERVQELARSLGSLTAKERVALFGLLLTLSLWLLPSLLQQAGLQGSFVGYLSRVSYLYAVPLYTSIVYFLVPVDRGGAPLLDWSTAQKDINWGMVLLIGGAMSFSGLFADKDIGLGDYIVGILYGIGPISRVALAGICIVCCTVLTSFISSTGFMSMFASLVIPVAISNGMEIEPFTVLLSALGNMDFIIPSGGVPGATAFSAGQFTITEMSRTAFPCVIAGVLAATVVAFALM